MSQRVFRTMNYTFNTSHELIPITFSIRYNFVTIQTIVPVRSGIVTC